MTFAPSRSGFLTILAALLAGYAAVAYLLLPAVWSHYEHQPGLADKPMVTRTSQDIPGDALNVGLVGDRDDVIRAMNEAGWYPADAITLKSSVEIIGSVLFDRPYRDAPVSPLYYAGRREDLAYERPVGSSADRRHHIRLWRVLERGAEGRPVWLGSATFDRGIGLSHYTGQVTHHIAPDIDAERDLVVADLTKAQMVEATYSVSGVGPTFNGRNGEGDLYQTDGEIQFARLVADGRKRAAPPDVLSAPPWIDMKDAIWHGVANAFGQ